MKKAVCKLKSISPFSQSRHYETEKKTKESPSDYEKRTWRDRLHVNKEGNIFIPPMMFKHCVAAGAKYLNISIPGQGKSKYTKHFLSGIMVVEPLVLPMKKDEVDGEWLFVPSGGKAMGGGGSRVDKCFPLIHDWEGDVEFLILDEIITEEVFTEVLEQSGSFIGIGRFRPANGGFYGRFAVESVDWQD